METTKPLYENTEEETDEFDGELASDEEIEQFIQELRNMFSPEELDEMFAPKIDEEYVESVQWEPSERHKKFMEALFNGTLDLEEELKKRKTRQSL